MNEDKEGKLCIPPKQGFRVYMFNFRYIWLHTSLSDSTKTNVFHNVPSSLVSTIEKVFTNELQITMLVARLMHE